MTPPKDLRASVDALDDKEVWNLYSMCLRELRKRRLVRSRNIVGDRAEFLAVEFYTETRNLPRLQLAPKGTMNVDALSAKGERYSIKGVTLPNKTTSVFYGLPPKGDSQPPRQAFEYVIIVVMNSDLVMTRLLELDWSTFLEHKKWHSRMKAWNLSVTRSLEKSSRVLLPVMVQ